MYSKPNVKTYGRSNKIDSNYIPKPISPFKITKASTVIDALFSKNVRKRDSSQDNKVVVEKKTRGRRRNKVSELPSPVSPTMLNDDSLDIKINSTFDNLLQGPVYNQVNVCNQSSLFVDNSSDTSSCKIIPIPENVQSTHNTRKKKKKNYASLHSDGVHITWEKSCNNSVLPSGKIRKKRNNPRKLKKKIKNVVNIPDTTIDNSNKPKKLHSYLDKSVNYSLNIERKAKQTSNVCVRKFTPIASTSRVQAISIPKEDTSIFRQGFRHLMRAENTPRYIHSSTPIGSRDFNIDNKLNVSPISVNAKSRLNFTSNSNKSFLESKKICDVSSIKKSLNITGNEYNTSNVILINSTIPEVKINLINLSKEIVIDDTVDINNSVIPVVEDKVQSVIVYNDKVISNKIVKENNDNINNSFITNDVKLTGKAVVLLEKYLDVLGINGDTTVICPRTDEKNKLVPVVCLERLSISKYLQNRELFVNTRPRNSSKNSQISSRSQSIIDELSCIENSDLRKSCSRNSKSRISDAQSDCRKIDTNEKIVTNRTSSDKSTKSHSGTLSKNKCSNSKKNVVMKIDTKKRTTKLRISVTSEDPSNHKDSNIKNYKSSTSPRIRCSGTVNDNEMPAMSSNLDSRRNRISDLENAVETQTAVLENTAKSLFDSHNSDIIENSVHEVQVPLNFVTTRKKKVQIQVEPITNIYDIDSTKPADGSSMICGRIRESKVSLMRIEDCKELKKYSNVFKIDDNAISRRKIRVDIANNITDTELCRKSIFLKPGKKWFRSLSILRRTNLHEIEGDKYCNKGRKWHDSVIEVLENQNDSDGALHEIVDESVVNDMKHKISSSRRATFGVRKSLKIVNISVKDSTVLAEETFHENKSGYVPTLAHVSILESFDKLSLSANVDDREETARQIILKRCGQTDPIPFDVCYSSRTLKKCRKIGEGVYGEVFMYKSLDNKCRVMKVIPIEGDLAVNGEHQKKFEEIISEIIIASELSNLRINNEFCTNGYAELIQISCVQGKYPQHLLDLWDLFDEERGSENDSPEIFTEDQLYIVLELENGGQDLEAYRFNNAEQSYALFVQVVCSLAVAESALQFEHRDMHWGNILISPTDETTNTFRLKGREFEVATKGVKVSVIDFTLSRMTFNNCCIYNDLAVDPDLFTATGDYQFDIYRLMKQRNQNDWQAFEPYTNILWLDYTLEKMINHVRYLRVTTKTHKTYIRRLSQMRKKILNYNSATELLNSDVFSHVFL